MPALRDGSEAVSNFMHDGIWTPGGVTGAPAEGVVWDGEKIDLEPQPHRKEGESSLLSRLPLSLRPDGSVHQGVPSECFPHAATCTQLPLSL